MTDTYDPDQPEYEEEYEDEQEEEQEEEQAAAPLLPIRGQAPIPMGEVDTGEALHGLVAFTRSVNLGMRDDNAHFRIEMPFLVQPGWSWPTIAAMAAGAVLPRQGHHLRAGWPALHGGRGRRATGDASSPLPRRRARGHTGQEACRRTRGSHANPAAASSGQQLPPPT